MVLPVLPRRIHLPGPPRRRVAVRQSASGPACTCTASAPRASRRRRWQSPLRCARHGSLSPLSQTGEPPGQQRRCRVAAARGPVGALQAQTGRPDAKGARRSPCMRRGAPSCLRPGACTQRQLVRSGPFCLVAAQSSRLDAQRRRLFAPPPVPHRVDTPGGGGGPYRPADTCWAHLDPTGGPQDRYPLHTSIASALRVVSSLRRRHRQPPLLPPRHYPPPDKLCPWARKPIGPPTALLSRLSQGMSETSALPPPEHKPSAPLTISISCFSSYYRTVAAQPQATHRVGTRGARGSPQTTRRHFVRLCLDARASGASLNCPPQPAATSSPGPTC